MNWSISMYRIFYGSRNASLKRLVKMEAKEKKYIISGIARQLTLSISLVKVKPTNISSN